MVKLIFALVVIVSSSLLGNSFSVSLTNRRKTIDSILGAVNKAKTLICFGGMDTKRVVEECFCTESFPLLNKDDLNAEEFDIAFKRSVSNISPSFALKKSDKELLVGFGSELGTTDVTGQVAHTQLYSELFSDRLRQVKIQENEKSRLYRILGFSVGSAVSLLIA